MNGSTALCRIALVSMHTSPVAAPGSGDAGGMNVYLEAVSRHLVAQGLSVDLLTRRTDPDQPYELTLPSGARLRHLTAGPPDTVPKADLGRFVEEFSEGLAELEPYDVVHSHYWLSGVAGLALASASGAPHVLNLHTVAAMKNAALPAGDSPEPEYRLRWEGDLVRASVMTVAATSAEAQAIRSDYGADPDRLTVIPPGVDRELFRPDAPAAGWLRNLQPPALRSVLTAGGYLMMAARTQPLKGHDLAIRALGAMDPVTRPPLVIVGDVSPGNQQYRAELEELVHLLGLDGEVWFLPAQPRDRLADLLRGAALLLAPSHSETFGLVTLEAAASGTPTVASRVNGLAEAVSEGVSGVLVSGFDAQMWAMTIDDLLSRPKVLAGMGVSATQYAAGFDWGMVAATLARLYRELAAQVSAGTPCWG